MRSTSVFTRLLAAAAGLAAGFAVARQPGALAGTPAPSAQPQTAAVPVTGIGLARDGMVGGNARHGAVLLQGRAVSAVLDGPGQAPSRVLAVSRSGNVAGMIDDTANARGFVRMRGGAVHALPPGFTPVAVNDAGEVAGALVDDGGRARSAVWRAGTGLSLIPDTDERRFDAVDINDRGEVVGAHPWAGVWSAGVLRPLPAEVPGDARLTWSASVAINNRGEILANGQVGGMGLQPFVWSGGAARVLPSPDSLGRAQELTARAMNDHGEAVGTYAVYDEGADAPERRAVLWARDGVRELSPMPGTRACVPSAINDAGTVLGVCEFRGPWKIGAPSYPTEVPVIWENGVARPLCGGGLPRRGQGDPCDPATYGAQQAPQVLTVRVHPRLAPYRLEFGVRDGIPVSVAVHRGDGTGEPQWIAIPDGSYSGEPVQLKDLNFDGYQDLSVVTMGGVHNESFDYYLFDPATSAFVFFRADNLLVPDSARRELVQPIHGSCCSGELRTFRWQANDLVLVRNEVWEPWPRDQTRTLRVVSELRNGRMAEVSRKVEERAP
jgi:hypothetical protein